MPRRKAAIKREILPDPLYGSEELTKFINVVMRAGKKSIAEKIVYTAITALSGRVNKGEKAKDEGEAGSSTGKSRTGGSREEVLEALQKSLRNIAPTVEVKSRRVGGATYQVPIEVAADRGLALAMRWVVDAAKGRAEKTMADRLSAELYDAYMGRGAAVKKRDNVHQMANANKAFAHYRW